MTNRQLKQILLNTLEKNTFSTVNQEIRPFRLRQVVNPLISFFLHKEPVIKWRAISALGMVVEKLVESDLESAKVVMRRLMWSLNDESGGIGWGAPEAMGEIMAVCDVLAKEYHKILVSYVIPEMNYIEHPALQKGVVWGIGRLAQCRPELLIPVLPYLKPFLHSIDAELRGLSAWACVNMGDEGKKSIPRDLCEDSSAFMIYLDGHLSQKKISELLS